MTFEVETGNASPTANSYVATADADAYHTLYGNSDWPLDATDAIKQQALVNATKACDLLFGQRYLSMPATSTQALLFPRFTFVINQRQLISSTQIPTQLAQAVCELALLYVTGTDILPTPNLRKQYSNETNQIGSLKQSITYGNVPNVEEFEGFWHIELLLKPLIHDTSVAGNPGGFGF